MVNWRFGAGWFGIRIGTPRSLIRERIKSCRSKKRLPVKSGRRSCGRKLSKNALNKKRLCLSWLSIGHQLTSPKGSLRLYFSLSMILQDGSAHKQVFANRQDAGSKPCFICSNIFYLRSGEEEHCKIFKEFIKYDKLHISTDQDVLDSWQKLAAKSKILSQADFKMHQQAAGLTYNEHALLSSEKLKECDRTWFVPQHGTAKQTSFC